MVNSCILNWFDPTA